jgi:leader peptidase (prepilin peptidase)/N-methyltransferase
MVRMETILAIPLNVRLLALAVIGACLGGAVNWAVYTLAWNRRPISPWTSPNPAAPRRRWFDRLPIVGWLGLRREAALHGKGFWIRPMLVEIFTAAGLAWLYWWETVAGGLLPDVLARPIDPRALPVLHLEFLAHVILMALMLAGSLIDADEKIIPDEITVAGTLIALVMAAAWPLSLLPEVTFQDAHIFFGFIKLSSPNPWPDALAGRPMLGSLCLGLACWWMWCVAILPRTWHGRHGWLRAVQFCFAIMFRQRATYRILRMGLFGSLVVILVWYRGGQNWEGLLTALVGMAAGGGLIWIVRLIGAAALRREAMGFGDVTLMAMIGAFLGWQATLVIFFLAPLAGVVIGLVRLIVKRDKEIPYGPFLCLAAAFVIIRWNDVWQQVEAVFAAGWLVPLAMVFCLALMALMLSGWRMIRGR